mgnify:CR=1 FL=1
MIIIDLTKIALELLLVGLAWFGEVPWWWPVAFGLWMFSLRYAMWLPGRRAAYEKELAEKTKTYLQMPSTETLKGWN